MSIFLFVISSGSIGKFSATSTFPSIWLNVCAIRKTTLHCQSKLVLTEREKDLPEQEVAAVRADSANFQTKLRAQSVRPSG